MSRLLEIYEGWKNYTFPNAEVEKQAKERMKICIDCKMIKKNNVCMMCGCYMPAKVRSPKSSCKLKKW
jgi:hypothetical protein